MSYLADREVNRGRQPEIDCLKAFCIFFMIFLHGFEELAEQETLVHHIITLIECLTGAGAFMLCMGIGTRYSRKQEPRDYLIRGFELLTVGQALNLVRDALPNLIAWWCKGEPTFIAMSLLVVQTDIMTFAGFAFMLLALFKKLKLPDGAIVGVSIAMNAFAFILSHFFRTTGSYLADQLLGFIVVTKAEAYFPLCCYFVFVAFGYVLGGIYPRIKDKDALSTRVLMICGPLAVAYYLLRAFVPVPLLPEFDSTEMYIMKPVTDALANCLMSLALLALFHKLLRHRDAPKPVNHLSGHINQYYCYSYVLLTPASVLLLATRGELLPGTLLPLLSGLVTLVICCLVIEWLDRKGLPNSITKLKMPWKAVVFTVVWIATIAVFAYAYPRITEFATIWNDYLGI